MKKKNQTESRNAPAEPSESGSVQRMARPQRGAEKDPYKSAWMAGAAAGTEIAYDLMMAAMKNMGRTLGIKKRKRPNADLSEPGAKI